MRRKIIAFGLYFLALATMLAVIKASTSGFPDGWMRPYVAESGTRYYSSHWDDGTVSIYQQSAFKLQNIAPERAINLFRLAHNRKPITDFADEPSASKDFTRQETYWNFAALGSVVVRDDGWQECVWSPNSRLKGLYYTQMHKLSWLEIQFVRIRNLGKDPFKSPDSEPPFFNDLDNSVIFQP